MVADEGGLGAVGGGEATEGGLEGEAKEAGV
jgi:hypothetical protein